MTAIAFNKKVMRSTGKSEIRFRIAYLVLIATIVVLTSFGFSGNAQAANNAEGYARGISKNMLVAINHGSEQKFRSLMRRHSDIRRIGMFSLGRYARKLPAAKRGEYLRLVEAWMARTFIKYSDRLKGNSFAVTRSYTRSNTNIIVSGKITGGNDAEIQYRLAKTGSGYKVSDINVLGYWMTQLMRSTFTDKLKQAKGNFAALFAYLR
jgi:ABC-type transporter MlaC component